MKHDHNHDSGADVRGHGHGPDVTPELEGISPLNPRTFPRAEDDDETFAHSPEFHDLPDPGPNVGRGNRRRPT